MNKLILSGAGPVLALERTYSSVVSSTYTADIIMEHDERATRKRLNAGDLRVFAAACTAMADEIDYDTKE